LQEHKRRQLAIIHKYGVTNLHRQNPYIVAWWSAAFPGFGHYMLNQYFRATLFTLTEVIINTLAHVNEAIVYTYCGKFELAKSVLEPRWALGYIIIYLYTIWNSYHSTLVQNKLVHLGELEDERLDTMVFTTSGIQYLELKSPVIAAIYSFFFPGLGIVYNHRFLLGFYGILWWLIYLTLSGAHESLAMLITGNVEESIAILNPHWLLFMPSVMWGATYHGVITAKQQNRLFRLEQRQFLRERYGASDVRIFD